MNILENFISENTSLSAASTDSSSEHNEKMDAATAAPSEPMGGDLLISGCCDWLHMTAKSAVGLDLPHRVLLPALVQATFSSPSSTHLFLLLSDHSLFAMGKNDRGQLGLGSRTTRHAPALVSPPWSAERRLLKVATGKAHSLFLLDSGEVYVCGSAACGQLGLGSGKCALEDALAPVPVSALAEVVDIACGAEFSLVCTSSGQVLAFGHPEHGQLGDGQTGQFLKEGKAGMSFAHVSSPTAVRVFVRKDQRGNVVQTVPANEVKVVAVAAGKNHCLCLEAWQGGAGGGESPRNRVFSWGFGGYGRLGHNGALDEMTPREVLVLSSEQQPSPQKQIRQIFAGSTYSLAVSASGHSYFFGILPNSPRGEACTYPRIMQELHDYPAEQVGGGSSWVMVASRAPAAPSSDVIFWGTPVAGKFGLEGNAKSSANPKFVAATEGLRVLNLACGYGHCCIVVTRAEGQDEASYVEKMQGFPEMVVQEAKEEKKATLSAAAASGKRKQPATSGARGKRGKK